MATVKLLKKSAAHKKAAAPKPGGPPFKGDNFALFDNEDDTFTVSGVDAAGNPLDITSLATLTATSSDPTVMSLDPPAGMTVPAHALKPTAPGTPLTLTFTATWNDGSVGPFTITLPVDITGTVATGLTVTPGTPTVRG